MSRNLKFVITDCVLIDDFFNSKQILDLYDWFHFIESLVIDCVTVLNELIPIELVRF